MPTPSLSKTWQHNVNNVVTSQAELPWSRDFLFRIKQALTGFATLPWTVINSSNGVDVGGDRWAGPGSLVWNTGAHSWIILQQPGTGGQLCIDLDYAVSNVERAYMRWSPGGLFAGGSITARPVATDEINPNQSLQNYWSGNQTITPNQTVFNVHHSTDGSVTRITLMRDSRCFGIWRFEALKQARAAHTNPSIAQVYAPSSGAEILVGTMKTAACYTDKDGSGTRVTLRLTGLSAAGSGFLTDAVEGGVIEEWDSEYWALEEHWYSSEVGHRGPKGSAFDSWIGQYQVHETGDTMPTAVAREFYAVGPYVWPWVGDGTIPQIA